MPHIVLEYSHNIFEKDKFQDLFLKIHSVLTEALPTDIKSCKSRAIGYQDYLLGDGQSEKKSAFVHVSIKVLSGRSPDVLKLTGQKVMDILKKNFEKSITELGLQISLEIDELAVAYFKV